MNHFVSFFKEDWQFFNYKLIKTLNGFLYFLRKLPGIKKFISERVYSAYDLKNVLGIFLTVLKVSTSFYEDCHFRSSRPPSDIPNEFLKEVSLPIFFSN